MQIDEIQARQALGRFIGGQGKKGKSVIISDADKERIIQRRYQKGFHRFLEDLGNAINDIKDKTGINRFFIICRDGDQVTMELFSKKPGEKILSGLVINLAKIRPRTPKYKEAFNTLLTKVRKTREITKPVEIRSAEVEKVPAVKAPQAISKEKREILLELGPNVKIYLSDSEGLRVERRETEANLYSLFLLKAGESLSIWLDTEMKEVSIGGKDYSIKEDSLVELVKAGLLDLYRREIKGREFPLVKGEKGEVIIELRRIEGNEAINQFLLR